jgi:hypothetical protein
VGGEPRRRRDRGGGAGAPGRRLTPRPTDACAFMARAVDQRDGP